MASKRLLMPFTQNIEWVALSQALQLAQNEQATLVALALLPSEQKGARHENWKQAKNELLNALQYEASKYRVPIELYEAFTNNVVQSIHAFVKEKKCQGIVIFLGGRGNAALLQKDETILLMDSLGPHGPELYAVQL